MALALVNTTAAGKEYVSCAETAVELRHALKTQFPGIKFSVKSKTYSGGASITVGWTDGPTTDMVERISKDFAGASFDGSIDLKSYHTCEYQGRLIHWGADFVFSRREHSPALVVKACAYVSAKFGIEIDPMTWHSDNRIVCGQAWAYHDSVYCQVNATLYHMRGDGCIVKLKVGA